MGTPNVPSAGTVSPDTTVEHAASLFEGLLFPAEAPDAKPKTTPAPEPQATDETVEPQPEADEPEPESEEPAPEAEETDPDGEPQPPAKRSRKLKFQDGTEADVDEDEAYNGYLRQKDYTQKTQKAAELRKQAEAELQSARQQREQYAAHLQQVKQGMDAMVPKEPDWATLKHTLPPQQFADAVGEWQTFKSNRDLLVQEQERVAKEQFADAKKQHEAYIESQEQKLLDAMPEWRDVKKYNAARDEMVEWMRGQGFSDDHIGSIADHRLILSLRNSMMWDKLQKSKPEAKGKRPALKSVAPGPVSQARKPTADARSRAASRLAKSGKTEDAAELFKTIPGLVD